MESRFVSKCPNSSGWSIDELCELIVLVAHPYGFICGNLIKVIHILEEVELSLCRWDHLQVLQYLNDHLGVHDRVRLLVRHLSPDEKVGLAQLV